MKKQLALFLPAALFLLCTGAPASEICTDRSPAAVAKILDIDPRQKTKHRTDRPNIVIIMVDDMGYADAGIYGGEVPTPNIDRIATNGVRFTAGYAASPICSPSRAGLMTGRQPNTIGYARNLITREENFHYGLALSEKTIADHFKEAGYITGFVGKWHLGGGEGYAPYDRGFDESFEPQKGAGGGGYYFEDYQKKIEHNLDHDLLSRMKSCKNDDKYLTDIVGLEATSFILRHRNEPFLLFLSPTAVHWPWEARKEGLMARLAYFRHPGYARYAYPSTPNNKKRAYLRMLMQLDEAIGHVLDAIDVLGLSENTLVWFFSDNGGTELSDNGILRGRKGRVFEGGIRVPFMVRWPGTIPAAVHDWPVTTLDVLPTSLAASGIHPEKQPPPLSGMNILPYLKKESSRPAVRDLYWRQSNKGKHKHFAMNSIRRGDWKLIIHTKHSVAYQSQSKLYNLEQDISEQKNLAATEPEKLRSLQQALTAWTDTLPAASW